MSRYRAHFRAQLKACQVAAALAGESTCPRQLIGKVNRMIKERNLQSNTKVLNAWNENRHAKRPWAKPIATPIAKACRTAGPPHKRIARAGKYNAPKPNAAPSSAGASGTAAPADTDMAEVRATVTTTATTTAAVASVEALANAKGDDNFTLSALLGDPSP